MTSLTHLREGVAGGGQRGVIPTIGCTFHEQHRIRIFSCPPLPRGKLCRPGRERSLAWLNARSSESYPRNAARHCRQCEPAYCNHAAAFWAGAFAAVCLGDASRTLAEEGCDSAISRMAWRVVQSP